MATEVTILLQRWREVDAEAVNQLVPLVYQELRRIAQLYLRNQTGHTLQPTALINEAWLKLFDKGEPDFENRAHFLAVMSRVMRQVLIDHARAAGAAKRWGGNQRVVWDTNIEVPVEDGVHQSRVLELDRALNALAHENTPLAEIVEMHYFGGMTAEEVAVVRGRSTDAVRHDLRYARAWLRRELAG